MSAIHVVGGSIINDQLTNYTYVLHIPTNADAGLQTKAQQDPAVSGFVSAVSNIDVAELDNIKAGTLLEESGSIRFNEGDTAASYLARLQEEWADRALVVPDEFSRRYRWFLNEYDSA